MNTNNTKETGVEVYKMPIREFDGELWVRHVDHQYLMLQGDEKHHQELQKARHDWLREEMVKLKDRQLGWLGKEEDGSDRHPNYDELQTIIDRYQSELDQPKETKGEEDALADNQEQPL